MRDRESEDFTSHHQALPGVLLPEASKNVLSVLNSWFWQADYDVSVYCGGEVNHWSTNSLESGAIEPDISTRELPGAGRRDNFTNATIADVEVEGAEHGENRG